MTINVKIGTRLLLAIGCLFTLNAGAAVFQFSQDGFTGGGIVTGTFVGEDLNGDGIISLFDGESQGVSFQWSGDAQSLMFSAPLNQGLGVVYDTALGEFQNTGFLPSSPGSTNFVGSGGAINVLDEVWWLAGEEFFFAELIPGYGSSQGAIRLILPSGDPVFRFTGNPTVVTQVVPLPAGWLLLASACVLLGRNTNFRSRNRTTSTG